MDHFVMFPMNENGVFWQPDLVGSTIQDALSAPFPFSDVFVYSHGWWTVANQAMVQYSQYSIEFTKILLPIIPALAAPPQNSLGIGIHWPSTLSEDVNSPVVKTQVTSYYQMGARAQQVGSTGVYAALATMFQKKFAAGVPNFRLTLIGHSFGCRVVVSALQRLVTELSKPAASIGLRTFVQASTINLVLLEAAFKNTELDQGGNYDQLANLPNLRLLITTSQLDRALNYWFPIAEDLNNLVHLHAGGAVALGAGIPPVQPIANALAPGGGPTAATVHTFTGIVGPPVVLPVGPLFNFTMVPGGHRLMVADLTNIHQAHLAAVPPTYQWDAFGGSHSDISCPEIHNLIAGFCFN
jgi:hypothetical protein